MKYGWSLQRSDWDRVLHATGDEGWSRCRLRLADSSRVPEGPGVYMICARPPQYSLPVLTKLYNALYIGRAGSRLRDRFKSHCNTPSGDLRRAAECFGPDPLEYWYLETPAQNVSGLESALIACIGPSANQISGASDSIRVRPMSPVKLTRDN